MNLLAFDTSTDVMSIAVQRGLGEFGESGQLEGLHGAGTFQTWQHTGAGGAQASSTLIPAILQLMRQADLRLDQLNAVVFGRGPGSFTGLRTACSVAQGLAFGAGVPVLPVDTLLAVAEEARYQWFANMKLHSSPKSQPQVPFQVPFQVLAVLDARMNEVYAAEYEFNSNGFQQNADYQLIQPENLVLRPGWHLAGNAVQVYGDRLPGDRSPADRLSGERLSGDPVTPEPHHGEALQFQPFRHIYALPTALAMLRLAPALIALGQAVAADQALPVYIRDKVAKTTLERMQEKQEKQDRHENAATATHNA